MDQIRSLRAFACVAQLGSFSGAARSMGLAPSVVTRLVAELEQHLGARLLTRTTRSVALTQIGQGYLARACDILRDVDEAAAAVQDAQRQVRGRVHITAPAAFAARQLVPRMRRLQAQHPDITLDIATAGAADAPAEAGDIRIVVQADKLDGDFVAHQLARSQLVLCAAPGYLRRHGRPRTPDELARHALLLAGQDRLPRSWAFTNPAGLGDAGTNTTVTFKPGRVVLSSHDAEVSHAGALAGMGIAALPSFAVHDDLLHQRLERVLVSWRLSAMKVHACLPSRQQVPAAVRATLNFLRTEFPAADSDPWLPNTTPSLQPLLLAA